MPGQLAKRKRGSRAHQRASKDGSSQAGFDAEPPLNRRLDASLLTTRGEATVHCDATTTGLEDPKGKPLERARDSG